MRRIPGKYARSQKERKGQPFRLSWRALPLLMGLAGLFSGCGYSLRHRLKGPFLSPRGIFVPVFDNQTDEVGAERVFTDALVRELQSRGEVLLGTRESGALEMRGVLRQLTSSPTAYTVPPFKGLQPYERVPTEIGVQAVLSLSLVDPKTKQVVWANDFSDFRRVQPPTDRTYNFEAPSSVGLMTQSVLESRYIDLARDIMRDVYDDMVELF